MSSLPSGGWAEGSRRQLAGVIQGGGLFKKSGQRKPLRGSGI